MFSPKCRIMKNESRIRLMTERDPIGNAKIIKALLRENRKLRAMMNE